MAAVKMMADAGAKPAFKGYYVPAAGERYKYVLCTSVNERNCARDAVSEARAEVRRYRVDRYRRLAGRLLWGFGADGPVGEISEEAQRLMKVTEESLELAIEQVRTGNRLFDICGTVEKHVVKNGFSIVREFVGHGIGTQLHEEPQIPNYVDQRNENPRLREGMVLAIEPMVNAGKPETKVLKDQWTAVTKDGSYSAHFEHCVAVTENGPWVLTRP